MNRRRVITNYSSRNYTLIRLHSTASITFLKVIFWEFVVFGYIVIILITIIRYCIREGSQLLYRPLRNWHYSENIILEFVSKTIARKI